MPIALAGHRVHHRGRQDGESAYVFGLLELDPGVMLVVRVVVDSGPRVQNHFAHSRHRQFLTPFFQPGGHPLRLARSAVAEFNVVGIGAFCVHQHEGNLRFGRQAHHLRVLQTGGVVDQDGPGAQGLRRHLGVESVHRCRPPLPGQGGHGGKGPVHFLGGGQPGCQKTGRLPSHVYYLHPQFPVPLGHHQRLVGARRVAVPADRLRRTVDNPHQGNPSPAHHHRFAPRRGIQRYDRRGFFDIHHRVSGGGHHLDITRPPTWVAPKSNLVGFLGLDDRAVVDGLVAPLPNPSPTKSPHLVGFTAELRGEPIYDPDYGASRHQPNTPKPLLPP